LRRHHGEELGADSGIGTDPRAAVADDPVDRRADLGVTEVQLREIPVGYRLGERRLSLLLLGIDDIEMAARRFECCARLLIRRERFLVVRIGLLEPLDRGKLIFGKGTVAVDIIFGAADFGCGCRDLRCRLLDHRLPQAAVCLEVCERRVLRCDTRLGTSELGAVIAIIELYQLSLTDRKVTISHR